jgi:hypothetical protein
MKRVIVVTAALLASALCAHAAPANKRLRGVNGCPYHKIVITKQSDAIRYALGIYSGQIPMMRMDDIRRCYPRGPDNENSDRRLIPWEPPGWDH